MKLFRRYEAEVFYRMRGKLVGRETISGSEREIRYLAASHGEVLSWYGKPVDVRMYLRRV